MTRDIHQCHYCGSLSPLVECAGMYHCNNLLCTGPGAAWFRVTLPSYKGAGPRHTVDDDEWEKKAIESVVSRPGYVAFWKADGIISYSPVNNNNAVLCQCSKELKERLAKAEAWLKANDYYAVKFAAVQWDDSKISMDDAALVDEAREAFRASLQDTP